MKTTTQPSQRKRPVNLLLNDEVVQSARRITPNLSATVEELLADYVSRQESARDARQRQADAVAETWNRFHASRGTLADDYSTL